MLIRVIEHAGSRESTREVGRARGKLHVRARGKLGEHEESWESTKKVGRARGKLGEREGSCM